MAKLTGLRIQNEVEAGHIIIEPFNEKHLGPNSYDLTLGPELRTYDTQLLDTKVENPTRVHEIHEELGYPLLPNTLYLGHTVEVAGSKLYVPCIEGRSSLARLGIQVHLTAGFGDVGFINQWTLEIVVVHPVRIYRNLRVCQIYFDTLEGVIDRLYNGKYVNSVGAVASRAHKDIEYGEGGRHCSICDEEQYYTPGGWTCKNGHGGEPPKEDIVDHTAPPVRPQII